MRSNAPQWSGEFMAIFTLTSGTDNFTGIAGENNTFNLTPATLQSTDVITGEATGTFEDRFVLTQGGTITAAQLAGVSGMELLLLDAATNITLTNGLAGTGSGLFTIGGSAGGQGDTIDGSQITNGAGFLVFAGDGTDTVTGGNGNDTLIAHTLPSLFSPEHDTLSGGDGDDTLYGEAADTLSGGAGFDVLQVINDFAINLDLAAAGIEYVLSGFGNDVYTAASSSTAFEVYGSGGNDQITGGLTNDRLWGGVGDDTLIGNGGNDSWSAISAPTACRAGSATTSFMSAAKIHSSTAATAWMPPISPPAPASRWTWRRPISSGLPTSPAAMTRSTARGRARTWRSTLLAAPIR